MNAVRRVAGWPAFWLGVACVVTKALHWSLPALETRTIATWFLDIAVSAHQDVLFACVLGGVGALGLRTLAGRAVAQTVFWWLYLVLCLVSVIFAVASIQIFAFLRSPLTFALLYLADDFGNMRSSLGAFISPSVAAGLTLTPLAWAFLSWRSLRRAPARATPRGVQVLCAAALAIWICGGAAAYAGRWNDRDDHLIAKSPHAALVWSYAREWLGLASAEQFTESYPKEFLLDFEPPPARPLSSSRFASQPRPKNVILVVLESTAAKYLGAFGSKYDTTPNLVRESQHALLYDAFYCHAGLTANSNAALTLSIYPYMTWREYTVEYPDMPGESLANVLKKHDYRTAFIHSGDLAFVNQRAFLTGRGFDTMWDWRDLGAPLFTSWATHDRALMDGVLKWLDEDKRKPFFAKMWTHMSHHPYDPMTDEPFVDFFAGGPLPVDDYDLGRYLNTLHFVDAQLGRLFDGLRERGLADDTLVVITGDHGEAFGDPHGAWGHGSRVYDECSRVPMMVWNPKLFAEGGRLATVGGHVDVNPTIADVLGVPASPSWRGRSLFDANRTGRAYFYAANDDYLLGVREGQWKYVYNATRGADELYDMVADPEEKRNVAKQHPDLCQTLRQRLAAWRDDTGRHLAAIRAARTPAAKPAS